MMEVLVLGYGRRREGQRDCDGDRWRQQGQYKHHHRHHHRQEGPGVEAAPAGDLPVDLQERGMALMPMMERERDRDSVGGPGRGGDPGQCGSMLRLHINRVAMV